MNRVVALFVAAGVALGSVAPAVAAEGCGRGGHRGPAGYCRPNGGYVADRYYRGRGYYHDNRWYRNRFRDHGGWRYR